MTTPPGCGLVAYGADGSPTYLPLISITANVHIVDVSARVVLTQLYVNDRRNNKSFSAQYIFPVPVSGAVCAFKMQTSGGQVVTGVVKERSKARNEYDIAILNNQWAGLLYEATSDVFVISIGAIPRGQDVEVTIMYVVQLSDSDLPGYDQVEFSLPTHIGPRYGDEPAELAAPSSSSKGTLFNIAVEIQITSEIESVSCQSHTIKVDTRNWKDSTSMDAASVKLDPSAPASSPWPRESALSPGDETPPSPWSASIQDAHQFAELSLPASGQTSPLYTSTYPSVEWLPEDRPILTPPNVIWAPAVSRPKKKAVVSVVWTAGAPIASAARLQDFDGSFTLDDKLCTFIDKKLSPAEVKSAMPSTIRGTRDGEKVWATVLAAAYMKVHLADDKDVWIGLWQKAADYVKSMLGSDFSFSSLIDEASKFLL